MSPVATSIHQARYNANRPAMPESPGEQQRRRRPLTGKVFPPPSTLAIMFLSTDAATEGMSLTENYIEERVWETLRLRSALATGFIR
jgi:hypothetical protein